MINKRASTVLSLFFIAVTAYGAFAQKVRPKQPNIIYIYADDLGYGELGCYGQQKIKTPNIDRLAAEGIRFTQHYAGAPVCAPSRCMLMTGRNAGHSYVRGNHELGGFKDEEEGGQLPLPEGTRTIGSLMQQAGYVTGAIGKWGLGMGNNSGGPNKHGFNYFFGYFDQKQSHNYYPTHLWENDQRFALNNTYFSPHQQLKEMPTDMSVFDQYKGNDFAPDFMTKKAVAFITENKDKPFFLYLPYTLPHVSLQAPDAAVNKYVGQFDEKPYLGKKGYLPNRYPLSTYAAMISTLDDYVGQVMKLVKDLGLDDNTIIMFSSDNGPTFETGGMDPNFFNSADGLRGRKMDVYEGGIREPFIARWPGHIAQGKSSDLISAQYDMMATLADLTGVKAPQNDGVSLLPTLMGKPKQQKEHPYLYFEYPENGGQVAIRMGDWKGVKVKMRKNKDAAWQIYNLRTDRTEHTDVAAQHPELVKQFDAIVKKEHQASTITEWNFISQ